MMGTSVLKGDSNDIVKSGKENMVPSRAKGKAVAEEDVRDGSSTGEFFYCYQYTLYGAHGC